MQKDSDSANSSVYSDERKSVSEIPKTIVLWPNLSIKLLHDCHAEELFSLTDKNRAYLKEWLPWLDTCAEQSDTLNFIRSSNKALKEGSGLSFGIFYEGRIAGTVSFNAIYWSDKRAEIGYWIGKEFQGLGLITTACSKVIDISFEKLSLEEIWISCAVKNEKSQNIPIRLVFKDTKFIPKKENLYGNYVDHILYILKRKQWKRNRN